MKIMVVDDDPDIRMIVHGGLRALGHEVVACESGEQAWKVLQTTAFPLLITDWLMPGIDGLQLTQLVRRAARDSYTYVIMLTAKGKREDYLTAVKAGVDAFLSKPLDGAVLEAQVSIAIRIIGLQAHAKKLEAIVERHGIAIDGGQDLHQPR
jgi:DNA-binding response OmpR family regulator